MSFDLQIKHTYMMYYNIQIFVYCVHHIGTYKNVHNFIIVFNSQVYANQHYKKKEKNVTNYSIEEE